MSTKRLTGLACASALVLSTVALRAEMGPPVSREKKLIGWGTNALSAHNYREHITALQADYPQLDGMIIVFWPDEWPYRHWGGSSGTFCERKFFREDFSRSIADLKAAEYGALTENFLFVATSVKVGHGMVNLDWFDERWHVIAENVGLYAAVAREVEFRGLLLDFEHYPADSHPLWPQFRYKAFKEYREKNGMPAVSLEDYCVQVRRRGLEMMAAVTAAYPDITVIMIPDTGWHGHRHYDLQPAFVDGILEGAGPNVRLIDGGEKGYPKQTYEDFMDIRRAAAKDGPRLSKVPELYRQRIRYGFGLWLDYTPDNFGGWHTEKTELEKNFRSPVRMEHAVYNALSAADDASYVWMLVWHPDYWWQPSSRGRLSPMHPRQCILCPHLQGMPREYLAALARARQPHDLDWESPVSLIGKQYTAEELASLGPDLIANGSFESWGRGANEFPDDWVGTAVERVRRVEGARFGKYAVELTKRDESHMLIDYVLPGAAYVGKTIVFGAWCKLAANSCGSVSILHFVGGKHIAASNQIPCPTDGQWHFMTARQTIPDGTEKILLRLNAYCYEPYAPVQFDGAAAAVEEQL